jgi:serine/threonine-protein phosphatase 6 regulatory ankyrin repeat subunit B
MKNLATVVKLLAEGHNPNEPNSIDGQTPLMCLAASDIITHASVVKSITKFRPDLASNTVQDMVTAYFATHVDETPAIATALFKAGANPNLRCKNGCTALMYAVQKGNEPFVKFLLEHGSDHTIPDIHGMTPLMCATRDGHASIVKCLSTIHSA